MDSKKEKMLSKELYDADDSELAAERERAREFTMRYNRTTVYEQSE